MEKTPFRRAAAFLPAELQKVLLSASDDGEEIRLRSGQPLSLVSREGCESSLLPHIIVTPELLRRTLEAATCASYHAVVEKLCHGFLPLPGGHRLGVSGSVDLEQGHIHGFRSLSSLNLRVAHQVKGVGECVSDAVFSGAAVQSTLILAPPGAGKTTLLRDLIRLASDRYGLRVSLADERGEVAALESGIPQLCVGQHTDVLDGCPKAEGMMLLLRSMNPQLLAADEITAQEDIEALSAAANCGVAVMATAHGSSLRELMRRPLYRRLMEEGIFDAVLTIRRSGARRSISMEPLHD